MSGPLKGVRVVEFVGIGPAPFCGMVLADMGADVVRVVRSSEGVREEAAGNANNERRFDVLARGKRTIEADLKSANGVELVLSLIDRADVLIEGFRPGVMERLGLGPEVCMDRNVKLVYGRMTGWGQFGPLSHAAGHDINYISITGMLGAMGRSNESMAPPLNLLGDFGGGAMMLAFGIACALIERQKSNKGQVIDAAMCDGAALLGAMIYGLKAQGHWDVERSNNVLDGAAHFYDTYKCSDGKYIAIGAIEPQFYSDFLAAVGLTADAAFSHQMDRTRWSQLKARLASIFSTRTRAEWTALMEGTDICFAPVLDLEEAPQHPHNVARRNFVEIDGVKQPAPAPRFSRTQPEINIPAITTWLKGDDILSEWI